MNEEKERTVSWFQHENALMHYGRVNKRSLVALICVCVTFILLTTIFVIAYTIREKNWLDTIKTIRPAVTEVQDGIYEQPDS